MGCGMRNGPGSKALGLALRTGKGTVSQGIEGMKPKTLKVRR